MDCSQCPHQQAIDRGDFSDMDFSKIPCFKCVKDAHARAAKEKAGAAASLSHKGRSHVSVDRCPDFEVSYDPREPLHSKPPAPPPVGLKESIEFVRAFVRLKQRRRDVLAMYLVDTERTYASIGKELGCSPQSVHQHMVTLQKHPIFGKAILARSCQRARRVKAKK